ncbi:MAG TPA: hypothetical protein VIQ02_01475, partial [Jiangellaceae bacterium]
VGPAAAIGLTAVAYELQGRWWLVAAAAGAALSVLLGAAVFRIDRRWRVDYAASRAAQAAAFAADLEYYSAEHRSFTKHMLTLLDEASERIGIQRMTLHLLEREIADLRSARQAAAEADPVAKGPGHVVDVLGEVPEWTDLWPDASDAPTVVDLVVWDERNQSASEPAHADDVVERSA